MYQLMDHISTMFLASAGSYTQWQIIFGKKKKKKEEEESEAREGGEDGEEHELLGSVRSIRSFESMMSEWGGKKRRAREAREVGRGGSSLTTRTRMTGSGPRKSLSDWLAHMSALAGIKVSV